MTSWVSDGISLTQTDLTLAPSPTSFCRSSHFMSSKTVWSIHSTWIRNWCRSELFNSGRIVEHFLSSCGTVESSTCVSEIQLDTHGSHRKCQSWRRKSLPRWVRGSSFQISFRPLKKTKFSWRRALINNCSTVTNLLAQKHYLTSETAFFRFKFLWLRATCVWVQQCRRHRATREWIQKTYHRSRTIFLGFSSVERVVPRASGLGIPVTDDVSRPSRSRDNGGQKTVLINSFLGNAMYSRSLIEPAKKWNKNKHRPASLKLRKANARLS